MLSPECVQGDKESDLLITALINGDRDGDRAGDGPQVREERAPWCPAGWRGGDAVLWLVLVGGTA